MDDQASQRLVAAGKSCGECGMCCRLMGVEAIGKPQFVACPLYRKSCGCLDYDHRPQACADFICYWLHMPSLDEAWRPDRSGFVLHMANAGTRLNVEVDPRTPNAWRAEPFHTAFRQWASAGRARGLSLMVWVGRRCFEVTPEGDIDRGMIRPPAPPKGPMLKKLELQARVRSQTPNS